MGLASPLAAIETFWWAAANNNAERMKQCIVFDRKTNAEPVSELYAKRETRSNAGPVELADGVRLLSQSLGMADSNRATIEIVLTGAWRRRVGETSVIAGHVPPCRLGYLFTDGLSAIETYITLTNAHQSW